MKLESLLRKTLQRSCRTSFYNSSKSNVGNFNGPILPLVQTRSKSDSVSLYKSEWSSSLASQNTREIIIRVLLRVLILKNIITPQSKDYYGWFLPVQTRWKDNDCYGHMNNAVYHAIYDSIINIFLIRHCGLSIDRTTSSVVGFMVI